MRRAYYTTTTKAAECRRSIVIQSFSKPLNIFNVLEVCEVIIPHYLFDYNNRFRPVFNKNLSWSIRACPVIQRGQEHCLAVPQPAGDYTPADCGDIPRLERRRGISCPQLFYISQTVSIIAEKRVLIRLQGTGYLAFQPFTRSDCPS